MSLFPARAVELLVIALLLLIGITRSLFRRVDRTRLEVFAVRQALVITPGNGNLVLRYLATTRRWRAGSLYAVVLAAVTYFLTTSHTLDLDGALAFSGWFVGAVIVEWRVDSLARGPRSAALLHRRRVGDYVRSPAVALAILIGVADVLLAVMATVLSFERSVDQVSAVTTLATGLIAGTAITRVVRRILQRPQPVVAADLIDADNAIRGRSLNVLIGSALAIGGYQGAVSIGQIAASPGSGAAQLAHLLGFVALPIVGVIVGRAPRLTPVAAPPRVLAA